MKVAKKKISIPRKKKSKKTRIVVFVIISLAVIGGLTYFFFLKDNGDDRSSSSISQNENENDHDIEPRITEDQVTGSESPDEPAEEPAENRTNKQLTPSNKESTEGAPLKPTISSVRRLNSSEVQIVATFNQTANGSCKLELSKPGARTIVQESPVTIGPSYYLCGFTVSGVEGGNWTASVTHLHAGKSSETVRAEVN